MASLTRYGAEVGSAFSLLGQNENDLTAALGFTMALILRPPPEQPATPAAETSR